MTDNSSLSLAQISALLADNINKGDVEDEDHSPVETSFPHVSTQYDTSSAENSYENISKSTHISPPHSLKTLAKQALALTTHDKGNNRGKPPQHAKNVNSTSNMKQDTANKTEQSIDLKLSELKDIKKQVNKIEATTTSLAEQLVSVVNRMAKLESNVPSNANKIHETEGELSSLKKAVQKHEQCLSSVASMREEIKELAEVAKNQVIEVTSDQANQIKAEIMSEVNKQVDKIRHETRCQTFKDQAFHARHNLVITGLAENKDKSTITLARKFITDTLSIKDVTVNSAHRIGSQPIEGSAYARPILVKFNNIMHRNNVWKNRSDITRDDSDKKICIQADLPKTLHEGVQNLYKVAKAASKTKEFESAQIRDYQLELVGKTYQITELEKLPMQLRPSTLAAPSSKTTMAFFSRNSPLSNHYLAKFTIDGRTFHSMEHYLAFQRAVLSENKPLIKKARKAHDPLRAKHILNTLKEDYQEEWNCMLEELTLEGLRGKFSQNLMLKEYLKSTCPLSLGEASKNPVWGIGMDLNDENVLDQAR